MTVFFSSLQAQEEKGLIARYLFSGNTHDEISPNHAKAVGGTFVEDRFGNPGAAYYIPGNKTDYINLGSAANVKPQVGTISLWVNIYQPVFSGYGADHNPILYTRSHAGDDCNEAFFIGYHLTLRQLNCCTSLSEKKQVVVYQTGTCYLRQWYHLVMTYDDKFLAFYIDGVLHGKTPKDFHSVFLEGDSVMVGNRSSTRNNRYMQGCVDDISIYNRVLSPEEVMALYKAPNPNHVAEILKYVFIGLGILSLLFVIAFLIRRRIKFVLQKEKDKNELLNKWYEQENRVLSAQMDPHFIFNSLNTIQEFIITNENDKAQMYLSKFSRLMRKILESNTKDTISLKEEIEIFEKYLEIESLRFNKVFSYSITVDPAIDTEKTRIPHFLIQPLIENAIWHGLLPKEGDKQLTILIKKVSGELLSCEVKDNGVGRQKKENIPEKIPNKQSFAINFIEQRLLLLSKLKNVKCEIKIIDNTDSHNISTGTTVILTVPIINEHV